jgi:hypothetical protein
LDWNNSALIDLKHSELSLDYVVYIFDLQSKEDVLVDQMVNLIMDWNVKYSFWNENSSVEKNKTEFNSEQFVKEFTDTLGFSMPRELSDFKDILGTFFENQNHKEMNYFILKNKWDGIESEFKALFLPMDKAFWLNYQINLKRTELFEQIPGMRNLDSLDEKSTLDTLNRLFESPYFLEEFKDKVKWLQLVRDEIEEGNSKFEENKEMIQKYLKEICESHIQLFKELVIHNEPVYYKSAIKQYLVLNMDKNDLNKVYTSDASQMVSPNDILQYSGHPAIQRISDEDWENYESHFILKKRFW